jgi:chromosome segregation protein
MKQLKRVVLVQFYLHEAFDIEVSGSTAFLGPNGSGKSSTLDAIQIAMLGGNQQYARFNTQSVSTKQRRSLASYCLGILRNPEKDSEDTGRARDEARTYIVLVFDDDRGEGVLSAGICIEADVETNQHEVQGLFVLPGQDLKSVDCIVSDGDDYRPMSFPEFRERARDAAKQIGRTPIFTDKSSEYVSELLYALNGERMPDPRRFMSSFVKSMTLKNVDSIDSFVREYVVEPNPIDIATFRNQVDQFIALRDLVKRTKARIGRLTGILETFKRAASTERRIAWLKAIKAIFDNEHLCEKIDDIDEKLERLQEQREQAAKEADQAKKERDLKQDKVTDLKIHLENDQGERLRQRLQAEIDSGMELIKAYQQPSIGRANRLVNAVRDVLEDDAFVTHKTRLSQIANGLVAARASDDPGLQIEQTLRDLRQGIDQIERFNDQELSSANRRRDLLEDAIQSTRRRIAAARETGRLLNDGAALLLDLLSRENIQALPVSALANISDPRWAPALEAYLGGDRDALVVTEGETRDAVRALREARRQGRKIDGASVIQPYHLRSVDISPKGPEFVVSLFEVENDTARRFLWNKFGKMRLVDTEEELEKHARAITIDGMLSQGGLTKSIRVASFEDLRIGKSVDDTSDLSRHVADQQQKLDVLKKRITRLEALRNAFSALSPEDNDDSETSSQLEETEEKIRAAQRQLDTLDLSEQIELRAALKQAESEYTELDDKHTKASNLAAGIDEQIKIQKDNKEALEKELPEVKSIEKEAVADPLVDSEGMDQLKDEIERLSDEYPARLQEVERRINDLDNRLGNATKKAFNELTQYVQDERLDVQLFNMDWHDQYGWASEEHNKLFKTELQNYETEAEQARLASEETLRSDIAMSLHDRFREMDLERRERNKILDSCPAFTGGERYRFVSSVVPQYESLVRYINQIAKDDQTFSLFGEETDGLETTLRNLVEAAAESGNAAAVLDYRQFYTFDLDILVDGKRVDRMSNRQGAGSNGEHIAPMYVAAGAALAKAYRIHGRKGQQGAGLICLDEAFHGMDTINAVATARFLHNIGLQLIMAGPELERTKLAPITQTIYDLDREGLDLLMERTWFKPSANSLMVSDMPGENPQVMKNAYQQLGLEMPPESPDPVN